MALLVLSVANAETKSVGALEADVKSKYGITIKKNHADRDDAWYVNDAAYLFFLDNFIAQAERQSLSQDGKKRFFPVELPLSVYPENWSHFDSTVSYIGSDIGFDDNSMHAGHKSARGAVQFIIANFPLEGTEEAFELGLRNLAVRTAIIDIVRDLASKGVDARSCNFSDYSALCYIEKMGDIAYDSQERLLQGLLNLQSAVDGGKEVRSRVNVTPLSWYWQDKDDRSWNRWFINDEKITRNKIEEYMNRLRTTQEQ